VPSLNAGQIKAFIKWFIDLPSDGDYKKLNFFGGEPFLEFDLLKDAIIFFKKNNTDKKSIIDTIPTNGTILSQGILNFVKEEGLRVSFSLDGDRINNMTRTFKDGKTCFDLVWNNLKMFSDFIGEPPLIKMTILPSNVKDLYSNVKFLVEHGFYKTWPNPGVFKVKWERADVEAFTREYKKLLKFYLKRRLSGNPINLVPVDNILKSALKGELKENDFFCGLGEEPILSFDRNIYTCDSVLLEADDLVGRFKIGEMIGNKINIDFNKMQLFQKYSIFKDHELRNKDHFLAHLFRRRPCFALDENGKLLKNEHIENILELHLKMYELSLDLFKKYSHLLK